MSEADLEPMYALHADPEVWRHLPSGRHLDRARTRTFIRDLQKGWVNDGLGHWSARLRTTNPPNSNTANQGTFVGIGGCARRLGLVWNIYYRLMPAAWHHGYATEIVAAARSAAARIDPDTPIVAYLLAHNLASRRTAERAGLTLAWSGPDVGNPSGMTPAG